PGSSYRKAIACAIDVLVGDGSSRSARTTRANAPEGWSLPADILNCVFHRNLSFRTEWRSCQGLRRLWKRRKQCREGISFSFFEISHDDLARRGLTQNVLLPRHAQGDQTIDGLYLEDLKPGLHAQVHFFKTREQGWFAVAHLHDLRRGSRGQIGQVQSDGLFDRPVRGRYGRPVRVARGVAQVFIDVAFQVFREHVLQLFGFIMDPVPGDTEGSGEI